MSSNSSKTDKKELAIISFKSSEEWQAWLKHNHTNTEGIWLQFYKKGSGVPTITYSEALDEALCYGWIDGQLKKHDASSYLHKFTPRRARSMWSKRNIEHVTRLEKEGKMHPSGLKEVESAKEDGRWERAYDSPAKMSLPEDFIKRLSKDKKATAFFKGLNKANQYAILWRLQTAKKPETRENRLKAMLEMLAKGEKFH
jgi:uncharacterized protein YdeI (YjbR/CyaY-like superfamily)